MDPGYGEIGQWKKVVHVVDFLDEGDISLMTSVDYVKICFESVFVDLLAQFVSIMLMAWLA